MGRNHDGDTMQPLPDGDGHLSEPDLSSGTIHELSTGTDLPPGLVKLDPGLDQLTSGSGCSMSLPNFSSAGVAHVQGVGLTGCSCAYSAVHDGLRRNNEAGA